VGGAGGSGGSTTAGDTILRAICWSSSLALSHVAIVSSRKFGNFFMPPTDLSRWIWISIHHP
jgi:hypothetical protein